MPAILIDAARCWREARDNRQPVQPSLFALLSLHGHGMLAPVFDSLMTLSEGVAGKRIATGKGQMLSEDEHRLVALFEQRDVSPGSEGLIGSLHCAATSLRILLTQSIGAAAASLAV